MTWMRKDNVAGGEHILFYVTHAVGANADNWWTDIMLVQYFIRNIYQLNGDGSLNIWQMTAATRSELGDLPDPHKDFKNLKKTTKWIRNFQIDGILLNSSSTIADGRVDPAFGLWDGAVLYTIHRLNLVFRNSLANAGIEDWYPWTMGDPGLPTLVKAELRANAFGFDDE